MSLEKSIMALAVAIEKLAAVPAGSLLSAGAGIEAAKTPAVEAEVVAGAPAGAPGNGAAGLFGAPAGAPAGNGAAGLFGAGNGAPAAQPPAAQASVSYEQLFKLVVDCAEKLKGAGGDAKVVEFSNRVKTDIYSKYATTTGAVITALNDFEQATGEVIAAAFADLMKLGEIYGC